LKKLQPTSETQIIYKIRYFAELSVDVVAERICDIHVDDFMKRKLPLFNISSIRIHSFYHGLFSCFVSADYVETIDIDRYMKQDEHVNDFLKENAPTFRRSTKNGGYNSETKTQTIYQDIICEINIPLLNGGAI